MIKERRVKMASREALKFHARLEDLFLALVLDVNAWVSDSSSIFDFLSRNDPRYAKGPGSKDGYYIFRRCKPVDASLLFDETDDSIEHEWEYEDVEEKGFDHTAEIIKKTKYYFGVDISPIFKEFLPKVFQYISENMDEKRRAALEPEGWVGERYRKYKTNPKRISSRYWPSAPGFLFRVDEYADGRCVVFYKKRESKGFFRRLFEADRFDTSIMRPRLNDWLKNQGALPMNPWGRDDPRNIEKQKQWTKKVNADGSTTVTKKGDED